MVAQSPAGFRREHADVAQLVAHHLAKVRVAGSNPVVRSEGARVPHRISVSAPNKFGGVAEWLRQGPAKPCTRVRFPPPPRAISSVGERFLDTEEVASSILASPTTKRPGQKPLRGRLTRSFVFAEHSEATPDLSDGHRPTCRHHPGHYSRVLARTDHNLRSCSRGGPRGRSD